jgi:hypothetical protein
MNADDLERLVGEELARLPQPRAPRTLLPRVLAATTEVAPAPVSGWLAGTRRWRLAIASVVVALGVGLTLFVAARAWSRPDGGALSDAILAANRALAGIAWAVGVLRQASALGRIVWQSLVAPIGAYVLVLSMMFSLACAALWAALDRMSSREVSSL